MTPVNPISEFLAGWQPCYRHPSRRARGYCATCQRHFCRSCIFPDHRCSPSLTPRRRLSMARLLLGAGLLGGTFSAGIWTVIILQPPAAGVPPAVALRDRAAGTARQPPAAPPMREVRPEGETPVVPAPGGDVAPPEPDNSMAMAAPPEAPPPADGPQVAHSFNRGSLHRPAVLLTFDAGSESTGASEILDVLSAENIRTTFFLTGEFIRNHSDLVRRIVADGHEVGNHTETHLHLTRWEEQRRHDTRREITREVLLAELSSTQAAFKDVTGMPMAPLWRAPFGEYNQEILNWAAEAGWSHVGWTPSLDTLDWVADPDSHLYRGADEIARRLVTLPDRDAHGGHGAIVLMHLGSQRPAQERLDRILPRVLASYRSRGLELLTASAMMKGS